MLKVGDTLGDFVLSREVGRGSMGVVYEARQTSLGRRVAVKVLTPSAAGDPVWVSRFHAEANAAARLSHPGILPIFAVGEEGGVPYFAMEFVEGRDLAEISKDEGPPTPREAARIIRDAALALDHAHVQGVVHRDVKPGNVMVRRDGRVVVMDFGLAKHGGSSSLTATGSLIGTPYYMSPEQAQGDRETVGPKSDVYGLGATLYELLTGRPPFLAENAVALLRWIAEKDPTPPRAVRPGIPRDLETIALCCMEKRPERRYPSCRALADDLERFLRDEPISRRRPGPIERVRRVVEKNRVAAGAIAAAVILLAAGTFVFQHVLAGKEAEYKEEIERVLEEAKTSLAAGDTEKAQSQIEEVVAGDKGTKEQKDRGKEALKGIYQRRLDAAKQGGDPQDVEDLLARWRRAGRLRGGLLNEVLPSAFVTVNSRPPGASATARPLSSPDAEPIALDAPIVRRMVALGTYLVTFTAPGRVPVRTTIALLEPDGHAQIEVSLPAPEEVPKDMVYLGGLMVRAATRDGASASFDLPPFLLDRTEVTVGAYERYLESLATPEERAARTPAGWIRGRPPPDSSSLPVTGVTWAMADAYASRAGKRLPTDREFELAAFEIATLGRGAPRAVPIARSAGRANTVEAQAKGTLPVDRAEAFVSPSGATDLLGNAAEWSASSPQGDVWHALVVGGSYQQQLGPSVVAQPPGETSPAIGFRCAGSVPAPLTAWEAPSAPAAWRRLRLVPDGAVVETRTLEVAGDAAVPAATRDVDVFTGPGHVSYRLLAAAMPGHSVHVEALADEGPTARLVRRLRLTFVPPLVPGARASVRMEEARMPLAEGDVFVRLGTRFDLDIAADAGVEVLLPPGSTVSRTGMARARVGLADGIPAVRVPPTPGQRLRLEAHVPSAQPFDRDAWDAAAEADRRTDGLKRLETEEYLAWLAPEYLSELLTDRARAKTMLGDWRRNYQRLDLGSAPWGADRQGDRIVIRHVIERWSLVPKGGGAPDPLPGDLPGVLETYCRKDATAGRWLDVYDAMHPLAEREGRLRRDRAWVDDAFRIVVRPPYGEAVRAVPKGAADVEVAVDLAGKDVVGEIVGYKRVDPGSGLPQVTRAELERYGMKVVSERTVQLYGRPTTEFTTTDEAQGVFRARRRFAILQGEGAILVIATATSSRSLTDALATLEAHRKDVDRFFEAVVPEEVRPSK